MVLLLAYQLGWYGYATLQQPVDGGCTGFTDLILPGRVSTVDQCITNNWGRSGSTTTKPPANNKTGSPTSPPGAIPVQPGTGPPAPTFT